MEGKLFLFIDDADQSFTQPISITWDAGVALFFMTPQSITSEKVTSSISMGSGAMLLNLSHGRFGENWCLHISPHSNGPPSIWCSRGTRLAEHIKTRHIGSWIRASSPSQGGWPRETRRYWWSPPTRSEGYNRTASIIRRPLPSPLPSPLPP